MFDNFDSEIYIIHKNAIEVLKKSFILIVIFCIAGLLILLRMYNIDRTVLRFVQYLFDFSKFTFLSMHIHVYNVPIYYRLETQ